MPEGSRFWLPAQRSLADQERWFSLDTMAAIVSMLATMVTMVVVANGETCKDAAGFKDSKGNTCEHYTNNIRNCFHEDAKVRNSNGTTACNACCACNKCPNLTCSTHTCSDHRKNWETEGVEKKGALTIIPCEDGACSESVCCFDTCATYF